ncbi:MAG: AAA family ATPase [Sulfolobales archaeon]
MCDMRDRVAILITGLPGSGKSIVSTVARECGLPVYTMGDIVREEILRRGLQASPQVFRRVSIILREELGLDAIAKLTLDKICRSVDPRSEYIVIDGVRSLDEVRFFKRHFKECIILAIHASPQTRFSRLSKRGREDDPRDWSEFESRDLQELSLGIGSVIALADIVLLNEEVGLEEFKVLSRRVIERITKRKCL